MSDSNPQLPLYAVSKMISEKHRESRSSIIKQLIHLLREHSGIWYIMIANFIFASCVFALKLVPADMFDVMVVRYAVQSLVFGCFGACYKGYKMFNTNGQPVACILNIITSSGTSLVYLAAYYFIPLADLNTIRNTYIVWAAILSVIFLKDRFRTINGITLVLAFLGLILATRPDLIIQFVDHVFDSSASKSSNVTLTTANTEIKSSYYYIGIGLATLAAVSKAVQFVARKQLVTTKQPYSVMNFQFTTAGLVASLFYSVTRRFWMSDPYQWKWMFIAGVIFGGLQLITNTFSAKALKRENVQLLTVLGSLDIVYAVVFEYIFFRQSKSWVFFVGATLIVLSAVLLSVDRYFLNQRERKKQMTNTAEKLPLR